MPRFLKRDGKCCVIKVTISRFNETRYNPWLTETLRNSSQPYYEQDLGNQPSIKHNICHQLIIDSSTNKVSSTITVNPSLSGSYMVHDPALSQPMAAQFLAQVTPSIYEYHNIVATYTYKL